MAVCGGLKLPINETKGGVCRCCIIVPEATWSKEPLEDTRGTHLGPLQDQALVLLAAAFPLQQSSASGVLKHLPDTLVGLGRALEVLVGTNLLANFLTLFGRNCGQLSGQSLVRQATIGAKGLGRLICR